MHVVCIESNNCPRNISFSKQKTWLPYYVPSCPTLDEDVIALRKDQRCVQSHYEETHKRMTRT